MTNTLRKTFVLFFLSFIVLNSINAQSLRAYIKAADNAFVTHDYFTALVYYKKVLEVEPTKYNIHFKYAESARLFQAYRIAEDAYHKITLSRDSINIPLATFWLASVKKNLGKYEEAEVFFNIYLEKFKRVNPRYSKRAEKDIIDCRWASRMVRSQNSNVKVEHLKDGINSPYSEFGAIEVDSSVYFSSMKFIDKKLTMYSKLLKKTKDGEIEEFDFNEEKKFAANPSLSFDGNRLYYTLCKYDVAGNIKCEIVYRDKKYGDVWGAAQSLPAFINFPGFTATHPSIGYDKINEREVLFFSSNRPGGKGKLDIWYSTVAPNGKFTRPVNHSIINSRENDVTPFFHSSSQTLYFSSDGYPGMGGYDIYKVKRNGRSWETPIHLIYPLNSSYNDFYYSLNKDGQQSYFASNRIEAMEIDEANEACCNDLFSAKVQPDEIELTKDEYFALVNKNEPTYTQEEIDIPKVIIKTQPVDNLDLPETILGGNYSEENTSIANNSNEGSERSDSTNSESINEILKSKGENKLLAENKPNNTNTSPKTNFDDDVNLSREVFSLVFEVEILDMDLEPLSGVTVQFLEKSKETNSRDFTKKIKSGNKIKFRIKDHVGYAVVLSKPGFETDTFAIDRENLLDATELTLPFFMNQVQEGSEFPESPVLADLEEELVTDDMLNSFIPMLLYFNNNEPDPQNWSNTTNKNYEQTFLKYYSKKERFKDRYVRKFAPSQRQGALNRVDEFFENDVRKNYQNLISFSDQLAKYLEKGNKVTIGLQGFLTLSAANNKNTALMDRRMSSLKNHFRTHLAGKLVPYIETGFLKFDLLDPIILTSTNTNGTYSPEASKLRKVEIKILKFNDF